jgi:hypothetical protein
METEISISCTDNAYIKTVSKFLLVLKAKLGEVDKKACLKLKISREAGTPSEGLSCVPNSPEADYFSVNGT